MAHINLLPWREEKRQERQQQFFIAMGLTLALAIIIFAIFNSHMNSLLDKQNQRNAYLQKEIIGLDLLVRAVARTSWALARVCEPCIYLE